MSSQAALPYLASRYDNQATAEAVTLVAWALILFLALCVLARLYQEAMKR